MTIQEYANSKHLSEDEARKTLLSITDYAENLNISVQATYKKIKKLPYKMFVVVDQKKTFMQPDVLSIDGKQQTRTVGQVEQMNQQIEQLTVEISRLRAENEEKERMNIKLQEQLYELNQSVLSLVKEQNKLFQSMNYKEITQKIQINEVTEEQEPTAVQNTAVPKVQETEPAEPTRKNKFKQILTILAR